MGLSDSPQRGEREINRISLVQMGSKNNFDHEDQRKVHILYSARFRPILHSSVQRLLNVTPSPA
jgi:hypothetical protein